MTRQNKVLTLFILTIFASSIFTPISLGVAKNTSIPIPQTEESSLALKNHAIETLSAINSNGEDSKKLSDILQNINTSVNGNFWDDYHIKTKDVFIGEKQAVRQLQNLINTGNQSDPYNYALTSALTMLVQSDRVLANTSINDAVNASHYVKDPSALDKINRRIINARTDLAKAEEFIGNGNPFVAVQFFENSWVSSNEAVSIADSNTVPTVTIVSPINGIYTNQSTITVSGTVFDVAIYSIKSVSIFVNGKAYNILLNNSSFSGQVQLSEGSNDIKVSAIDTYHNMGVSSVSVILDTIKPAITVSGVSDRSYYNYSVRPMIKFSDINLGPTSVILDGAVYIGDAVGDEGKHVLDAHAVDLAGNSADLSISFVIDKTPPVAEIYGLQVNSYLSKTILVNGGMIDVNPGNVSLRIDDTEVSRVLPYLWNTSLYPDGNHTIELFVTDKAGNGNSAYVSLIVDNTPPSVKFLAPANGSMFPVNLVDFIWDGSDNYGITFYELLLDSQLFKVSSTNQTINNIPDGDYEAVITGHDLANNTAFDTVNVTVDTTPPAINITGIRDGGYYNYNVTPIVNVTDANLLSTIVTLNGQTYEGEPVCDEGVYTFAVYAEDRAGHSSSATVIFTIDKTPPSLSVTELSHNPTIYDLTYTVNGTVEQDALLTMNNDTVAHDGIFEHTINLSLGVNSINVTATDLAGNIAGWNKTRQIDEDTLPDFYETNVLCTDPLNNDSDSTKTVRDESSDGIPDDTEDLDSDGLKNIIEYLYNTDPFKADTDGDGLPDPFELEKSSTSPLKVDSDNNSMSDADEDPDHDGLTNLQEYKAGTFPMNPDYDKDGLNDGEEINVYHTNPLTKDSDNDGLEDGSEVKMGTDRSNPDTDGDGIQDGKETYVSTINDANLGLSLSIQGVGDMSKHVNLYDEQSDYLINSTSLISKVATINGEDNFTSATLNYQYDPSYLADMGNVAICNFNDTLGIFVPVDTTVNTVDGTIRASLGNYGSYGVFNVSRLSEDIISAGEYNEQLCIPADDATVFSPETSRIDTISQVFGTNVTSSKDVSLIPQFEWLPGFSYKQVHYIQGSNDGALANYQINFQVYVGSGTSTGNRVYLNNHMLQSDYSDIRFTDAHGQVLHNWIEDIYPDHASIWVKIPYIPAGSANSTPVYIFYGNSTIGNVYDGNSTFVFFDDFSGPSIDSSKWAALNGASIDNNMLRLNGSAADGYWAVSSQAFSAPYVLEWHGKVNTESSNMRLGMGIHASSQGYIGDASSGYLANNFDINNGNLGFSGAKYSNGGWSSLWNKNFRHYTDTLYRGKIIAGTTGIESHVYDDRGNELVSASTPDTTWQSGYIVPQVYGADSDSAYDYIFIRNYTPNEPAHGSWGNEIARALGMVMSVTSLSPDPTPQAAMEDTPMISGAVVAHRALSDKTMADMVRYNASRPYDSKYLGDSFVSKIQIGRPGVAAIQIANTGNTPWGMNNSSNYPRVDLKPYDYDATILGSITASPVNSGIPGSVNVFFVNMTPAVGNMYYCPMYVLYVDGEPFGEIISTAVYVEDPASATAPKANGLSAMGGVSASGTLNSQYISNTMPDNPPQATDWSQYRDVSMTFQNTGSDNWIPAANSEDMWNPNGENYVMIKALDYDPNYQGNLPTNVPGGRIYSGQSYAFPFQMLYSNAGSYNTRFQLQSITTRFGAVYTKSYTVQGQAPSPSPPPADNPDSAVYDFTLPTQLEAGQSYAARICMYNTGDVAWSEGNGIRLGDEMGPNTYSISGTVNPGSLYTWYFNIVAPSMPGTYTLKYRMEQNGQWFGAEIVQTLTVVPQTPPYNAQYISDTIPDKIYAGQSVNVQVVMKNTGTRTWDNNFYGLYDVNDDNRLFSDTQKRLSSGSSVAQGDQYVWHFTLTAPKTAGTAIISYQMYFYNQRFGDIVTKQVTVLPRSPNILLDTDGDGLTDLQELHGFRYSENRYSKIMTKPTEFDPDGDGLNDYQEIGAPIITNGLVLYPIISYPGDDDSDHDGLDDLDERDWGTNPKSPYSDPDGLTDGEEVYGWDDPVYIVYSLTVLDDTHYYWQTFDYNVHVNFGTNPKVADSDKDGYDDFYETKGNRAHLVDKSTADGKERAIIAYVYDPQYQEKGPHINWNDAVVTGTVEGYKESSPYKDNPFYVTGCKYHENIVKEADVILSFLLYSYYAPSYSSTITNIKMEAIEQRAATQADLQAGRAALLNDIRVASAGELKNARLALAEQKGTLTSKTIIDEIGDVNYRTLAIKYSDPFLSKAIQQGVDVSKMDEVFVSKNVYQYCPKLNEFIMKQTMENGVLKGTITLDLKSMTQAGATQEQITRSITKLQTAYTEYEFFEREAGSPTLVGLSHNYARGIDFIKLNGIELRNCEGKYTTLHKISMSQFQNYFLRHPITGKFILNMNYLYRDYKRVGIREPGIYWDNKNYIKRIVIGVNGQYSDEVVTDLLAKLPPDRRIEFTNKYGEIDYVYIEVIDLRK